MPDSTGSKPPKHEKSALARRHEQTLGTTRIDKGIGMSGQIRRFEFADGKSSKFWEIEASGNQFTVRYGKIGTAGQAQTKEFADAAAAAKSAEKLIAEKTGKGYQEVGGSTPPIATSAEAAPAKKSAVAKAKAAKPADLAKDPDADPGALEALAGNSEAIDRLLAKNSKANAGLLEKLSHSSDKTTRNYVVLHPNAPKDVLVKLAHQFPADFFRNPAFDWLLLEDPDLMQRIGGNVMGTLLKRPDCPPSFLNWAVKHGSEKERLAVAMNAEASEEALRELVSQGGAVADAAKAHEKLAASSVREDPLAVLEAEVRKELAALSVEDAKAAWTKGFIGPTQWAALSPEARLECLGINVYLVLPFWLEDDKARLHLARHSESLRQELSQCDGPVTMLESFADDKSANVRGNVAANPRCPALLLDDLAIDEEYWVRKGVASNLACPISLFYTLAKDKFSEVRLEVASNPTCPIELLRELSIDQDARVREAVAGNPYCPGPVLDALAADQEIRVRTSLAANSACPLSALETLAKDTDAAVRRRVAENSSCPRALLEMLARDMDSMSAGFGGRSYGEGVRNAVAAHSFCPTAALELLAKDKNERVRVSVAENPAYLHPEKLLEDLASSSDEYVRKCVAGSTSCPPSVLQALSKDKSVYVRRGVARNPSCPVALLEKLANKADVQEEVAVNPSCPPALFETLMEAFVREQLNLTCVGLYTFQRLIARREESSPGDLRLQSKIWRYFVKQLAIRFGNESGIDSMLATQDDDQLVSTVKRETALLLINPGQSLLSQVIQGATQQGILALSSSGGSAAAKSSLRAVRLLGLVHVHAPPDVLAKRSKSTDWADRLAVACNSSTPTNILAQLKKDPHQVVAEASRFGEEGKREAGGRLSDALLRNAELKVEPLVEEIRCRIRKVTDIEQLRNLHSSCWQTSISESQLISEAAAAFHPNTCATLLEVLAKHKEAEVRYGVAENPSCPPTVFVALLKDKDKFVRQAAARNPECRSKLDTSEVEKIVGSLVKKAKSANYDVREEVARNPLLPQALLEMLSNDAEDLVGWAAVSNPSFPVARLEEFTKKDSKYSGMWMGSVAEHPGCPASLLDAISSNGGHGATAVARHPNTSIKTLTRLAKDRRYYDELAQNPACPPAILEVLARDEDDRVRVRVAANPACPAAICEVLVEDKSDWVRSRMAANPACSSTVLDTLVMSGYPWLIWLAIHHDNATPRQLLKWAADERLHPALRHACVQRPLFPAREKALVDEITHLAKTPPQVPRNVTEEAWSLAFKALELYPDDKNAVAKATRSKDWLQRAAATFSPDIQPNQLKLLLDDSEEVVRQLAADRLRQRELVKS